jgi:hypothetical protein
VGTLYSLTKEWALRGEFAYQFIGFGVTRRF